VFKPLKISRASSSIIFSPKLCFKIQET
jgi:hypothetical protein